MANADCPLCQKLANLGELPGDEVVGQLAHSVALLGPWQYYHGHTLLVARTHATELSQLDLPTRRAYLDEMCLVAAALEACCQPAKMNYELLGNQVPHLHWHLFPRYAHDPDALKPVWVAMDRADADADERRRLQTGPVGRAETAAALRRQIQQMLSVPS